MPVLQKRQALLVEGLGEPLCPRATPFTRQHGDHCFALHSRTRRFSEQSSEVYRANFPPINVTGYYCPSCVPVVSPKQFHSKCRFSSSIRTESVM